MDQLLSERDTVNRELRRVMTEPTEGRGGSGSSGWNQGVSRRLSMKRSMSRQAEAERERRARIITADGEYQASSGWRGGRRDGPRPGALQLRLLQTVVEVASEPATAPGHAGPGQLLRFFEKMAPGPAGPPPAPPLEDTGDAEVAEAEAEIGAPLAAQLPDLPVPEIAAPEELAKADSTEEIVASDPAPATDAAPAANGPRRSARKQPDS
jgi:regulator of protease activity HflC (stomatin/prohibitin superfamily)